MQGESLAKEVYGQLISQLLPVQIQEADAAIRSPSILGSLASQLARDDYAFEAITSAGTFLAAACNGLQTIALMKNLDEAGQLRPAVTVNGTAALTRQALECAVTAEWLLESLDEVTLHQRGFAASWANAVEHYKFAREVNDETTIAIANGSLKTMIEHGTSKDYFAVGGSGQLQLRISVLNSTDLLKKTKLDSNIITSEVTSHGAGYANAAWLFRFTSGQTHGLKWATLNGASEIFGGLKIQSESESDDYLVMTKPTYTIINLALLTSCDLMKSAVQNLTKVKTSLSENSSN